MNLTGLIPVQYRLLALLLLVVACIGFGYVKGLGAGEDKIQAAWNVSKLAEAGAQITGLQRAAVQTHQLQEKTNEALKQGAARLQAKTRDLADARAESDGLRSTVSDAERRIAVAPLEAVRAYATTANAVLGDCQAKYLDMADKAAGHASDVLTLEDAWPVLPASQQPGTVDPPK